MNCCLYTSTLTTRNIQCHCNLDFNNCHPEWKYHLCWGFSTMVISPSAVYVNALRRLFLDFVCLWTHPELSPAFPPSCPRYRTIELGMHSQEKGWPLVCTHLGGASVPPDCYIKGGDGQPQTCGALLVHGYGVQTCHISNQTSVPQFPQWTPPFDFRVKRVIVSVCDRSILYVMDAGLWSCTGGCFLVNVVTTWFKPVFWAERLKHEFCFRKVFWNLF